MIVTSRITRLTLIAGGWLAVLLDAAASFLAPGRELPGGKRRALLEASLPWPMAARSRPLGWPRRFAASPASRRPWSLRSGWRTNRRCWWDAGAALGSGAGLRDAPGFRLPSRVAAARVDAERTRAIFPADEIAYVSDLGGFPGLFDVRIECR